MDTWMDRCIKKMNKWIERWVDEWMYGWTKKGMCGWTLQPFWHWSGCQVQNNGINVKLHLRSCQALKIKIFTRFYFPHFSLHLIWKMTSTTLVTIVTSWSPCLITLKPRFCIRWLEVQVKHALVQGPAITLVGPLLPLGKHLLLVKVFPVVPRLAFPAA